MDGTCNCCNSSNLSIGSPLQNYCPNFSYIFTHRLSYFCRAKGQKQHRFTYTAGKGLCRKPWHFSAPSLNWSSASSLVYFKVIFCALQSAAKLFLRTKLLEQVLCKSFIEKFTSLFYTISFFPFFVNNLSNWSGFEHGLQSTTNVILMLSSGGSKAVTTDIHFDGDWRPLLSTKRGMIFDYFMTNKFLKYKSRSIKNEVYMVDRPLWFTTWEVYKLGSSHHWAWPGVGYLRARVNHRAAKHWTFSPVLNRRHMFFSLKFTSVFQFEHAFFMWVKIKH